MESELTRIDALLQDADFTRSMAEIIHVAKFDGTGQVVPPFISAEEESEEISITAKEEKVAINLAGFYALECGIDLLSSETNEPPIVWLQRIVNRKLNDNTILLLNRFANATWKAGQPFRGMDRITRPTFIGANHLPENEVEKDRIQIETAAKKLLPSLESVANGSMEEQVKQLQYLLQDIDFAIEMASWLDAGYYTGQNQEPPNFITAEEEITTITKSVLEIKIADNIAPFYALECGLNYLATIRQIPPSIILRSIEANIISKEDKTLFVRFTNATRKAGQPFKGLSEITKESFVSFYFLSEPEKEKEWLQVTTAAKRLLKEL